jgi:hypothetical protein
MVIVVRTAVVVGVGVGSHGGREILDSSGRVLKELRLVGIEVDHDGVVIGVAVEVEEEVAGLEVVWFEIEAEKGSSHSRESRPSHALLETLSSTSSSRVRPSSVGTEMVRPEGSVRVSDLAGVLRVTVR